MERPLAGIVLAAGQGVRMKSHRAKVLHEVGGVALILRVLRVLRALDTEPVVVVVGHQADEVKAAVQRTWNDSRLRFAMQEQMLGTGHAALCGLRTLPSGFDGDVLIVYGDMPVLSTETLKEFIAAHRAAKSKLSLVALRLEPAASYGRLVRRHDGSIARVVEASDATPEELAIEEVNAGVYVADATLLRQLLDRVRPNNARGEYYLTDIVELATQAGVRVFGWRAPRPEEFLGVNSRYELAQIEALVRQSVNRRLMDSGVTLLDPSTTYIGEEVEIGIDSVIGPNVQILGRSRIGARVRIEGCALMREVIIGNDCIIKLGVRAEQCTIGPGSEIGPFANLRPGTQLEGSNRIGNFVETKQARIGRGTKASHLSYLGDVIIGEQTNIGCGVITVNFDGYEKHLTQIGSRCMVGCDSQLIAPVKIGDDAYVASGTTVRHDVPAGALAFCDHRQQEKPGWTLKWRERHQADGRHHD